MINPHQTLVGISLLQCYFAPEALCHQLTHSLRVVFVVTLQEHQFGNSSLYRHVFSADDTRLLKMIATVVSAHLDSALQALADVDDHFTVLRTLTKGIEQPGTLRGVASR